MTDTRQIAIDLIQQKQYAFWKLYEGTKRVAQCDIEENPDADPAIALQLFLQELPGRSGRHDISVYKKSKGESGGSRKTFQLIDTPNQTTMFGQTGLNIQQELAAAYERGQKDAELIGTLKRVEEKLDLILLYIKNSNDDDDKNDNVAVNLIGKVLGNAISKPAATVNNIVPRTAPANAGAFSL